MVHQVGGLPWDAGHARDHRDRLDAPERPLQDDRHQGVGELDDP